MLRRNRTIVTAALLAVCAVPSSAVAQQDLRMPDTRDAAQASAQTESGPYVLNRDYGSPDAADAARGGSSESGQYVLNRDFGSPDAADAARDLPPVQIATPVVEVHEPSGGFDWGDAGIGAAGMLALFSIAAGSALLVTSRRRRRGLQIAH